MKKKIAEFVALCIYNVSCFFMIFTGAEKLREIKESDEIEGAEKAKALGFCGLGFIGSIIFLIAGCDRILKWIRQR